MQNNTQRIIRQDAPKMLSVILHSRQSLEIGFLPTGITPSLTKISTPSNKIESRKVTIDTWQVDHAISLPTIYILERTHVYISGVHPRQVARRIAACFQNESIMAVFNNSKACAKAETKDHVHFNVQLFEDCGRVVVEVQRLNGCSFSFYQTAKLVLNAAKGVVGRPLRAPPKINTCTSYICRKQEEQNESITESLEIALSILNNDRLDTNILAMEILLQLTSCNATTTNRSYAANEILSGPLLEILIGLIQCNKTNPTTDSKTTSEIEEEYFSRMRCDALTIFANCVHAMEKSGKLGTIMQQIEKIHFDDVIIALVNDLNLASSKPHEACQAARCLQPLLRSSMRIRRGASTLNVAEAVMCASNTGSINHFMLQRESSQLKLLLECN